MIFACTMTVDYNKNQIMSNMANTWVTLDLLQYFDSLMKNRQNAMEFRPFCIKPLIWGTKYSSERD